MLVFVGVLLGVGGAGAGRLVEGWGVFRRGVVFGLVVVVVVVEVLLPFGGSGAGRRRGME